MRLLPAGEAHNAESVCYIEGVEMNGDAEVFSQSVPVQMHMIC